MRRRSTNWLASILACLAMLLASQTLSAADTTVRLPLNYGILQPPANGSSYTDPVFGTSIKRITNALTTANADSGGTLTWIEDEYSTASPFNLDNSRLILVHQSYFGLYDGNGGFLGSLPLEISSSSEPRWSRKDAGTLYYHVGNQLKSYNVSTRATSVVHTFSEYGSISGNGEMDISQDGDHFVFAGDSRYVFLYTISADRKSPVFDTAGHGFDSLYVTANNNVTISWNASGVNTRYTGIEMFDGNMNFLRQVAHANGHMHMSRDVNGDEVLIWTNSNDAQPACGQNAIVKIHLADAVHTCLLSLDWSLAVHISAADSTWAFVGTYNPSDVVPPSGWFPYTNELLQIKLDGSEVRRLAHHRSRPFNRYNYMPKLTVSRDGSRLVYASNFGVSGNPSDYSDEYLMTLSAPASPITPANSLNAVSNGATFQETVSPGAIVSLFGSGLAGSTMPAAGTILPTNLNDVDVSFNGVFAPLFYVSPGQINAQVPFSLQPGNVTVQVRQRSAVVAQKTISVAALAPGIFTTGTGAGAILRASNYSPVSEGAPTREGEYVSIFCTGLGTLKSAVSEGSPAPSPAVETVLVPDVRVGNMPATVTFAGLSPGSVGLYQVNIQIPAGVSKGTAVPLTITIGGASSNTATIAIQ